MKKNFYEIKQKLLEKEINSCIYNDCDIEMEKEIKNNISIDKDKDKNKNNFNKKELSTISPHSLLNKIKIKNSLNEKEKENREIQNRFYSFENEINYYKRNALELGRELNDLIIFDKYKSKENKNFLGLIYMFLSVLILSFSHLISKIMLVYFPKIENSANFFIRGIIIMTLAFYWIRIHDKKIFQKQKNKIVNANKIYQLILRCFFGALCNITLIESFKYTRISTSYTIFCTYPIFVSFLSVIYDNSKLRVFNIISYLACFISVIFISKPALFFEEKNEINDTSYGIFLAFISSLVNGIGVYLNKSIGDDFHCLFSLFLIGFWFILITALIIPFTDYGFSSIDFWAFLLILISALIFYAGLMLFIEAMNIGEPIKILPIFYFGIVFTLIYNSLIFGLSVDIFDIGGSLIILIVNIIGSIDLKNNE
jgi:drug/metabolite transporter (DMT)-like permease